MLLLPLLLIFNFGTFGNLSRPALDYGAFGTFGNFLIEVAEADLRKPEKRYVKIRAL